MGVIVRNILFLSLFSFWLYSTPVTASSHVVLILGDSLTEGYGIEKSKSFSVVLERILREKGRTNITVKMAGIGGATTASGLKRLKYHLKDKPNILVLALGANDGLRGIKVAETKKNLGETLKLAKKNKMAVLLAGMKVPPNYGSEYTAAFEKMFTELAQEEKVSLMPFLLEGVGGEPTMNQEDGIHPNEKGHEVIAKNLFRHLEKLF